MGCIFLNTLIFSKMQHNSSNQKYNSNHSWDRSSYLLYLHFGVTKEISHSSDFLEVSSRIMDDDLKDSLKT